MPSTPAHIRNPRRVLILSHAPPPPSPSSSATSPSNGTTTTPTPTTHPILSLLQILTGSIPPVPSNPQAAQSIAGLTHELHLTNAYYTADIPIWLDDTPDPSQWAEDFCADDQEVREVVTAVAAWIVVLGLARGADGGDYEQARALMAAVKDVIAGNYDEEVEGFEGTCLCVAVNQTFKATALSSGEQEEFEDLCFDYGFEFVVIAPGVAPGTRNAMGEKQGVERVREALEACDWSSAEVEDGDGKVSELLGLEAEDEEAFGPLIRPGRTGEVDAAFGTEGAQLEREFMGLKMELARGADDHDDGDEALGGEATQVEDFERMMGKLMAAREMSAHLPEAQRRKAAAKAVNDVMKTM